MGGVRLWASTLRRSGMVATVLLALFAGLAGGVVMTATEVARRTSTSLDRYLDQPALGSKIIIACPPGITEDDLGTVDLSTDCGKEEDVRRVERSLADLPDIADTVPLANLLTGVRTGSTGPWRPTIQYALLDEWPGLPQAPVVVQGRVPRQDAADEIVMNERLAGELELSVGDEVTIATFGADQRIDLVSGTESVAPSGTPTAVRLVGVIRTPDDLGEQPEPVFFTTAGWWDAYGSDDLAGYGKAVVVRFVDPAAPATEEAFNAALPDRLFQSSDLLQSQSPTRRVIELQTIATWVVALVALLAAMAFVGQTVARQTSRDLTDRRVVAALGMTRRDVVLASTLRMAPTALIAAVVASLTALIASPVGPIGLGRTVEISPGFDVDLPTLTFGGLVVVLVVLVTAGATASFAVRRDTWAPARPLSHSTPRLPTSMRAGISFLRRDDRTSVSGAVVGTALAIAMITFSIGIVRSYDELRANPERFGQTWQITLGDFGSPEELEAGRRTIDQTEGVAAVGLTRSSTSTVGDERLPIIAFVDLDSSIGPVILEGREPRSTDEIALGTTTLDRLHLQVGDTVTIYNPTTREPVGPLDVVGQTVMNDGVDRDIAMGEGGVVSEELFAQIDPASIGQSYLIRAEPGVSVTMLEERLRAEFGGSVDVARPPADLANLDRVASAPRMIAGLISLLALTALVSALLTVLDRRKRDIAVLRSIGFTRLQVVSAALTVSATLTLAAMAIGIPVGYMATRWGWSAVQTRLGIESSAAWPVGWTLVAAVVLVSTSLLVALVPAVRSLRVRPAESLWVD